MKRLNPETGKEFRYRDVRGDGFVFYGYDKKVIYSSGFCKENWFSPTVFEKHRVQRSNTQRQKVKSRRANLQKLKCRLGCVDCGYNANGHALDFDHVGSSEKSFNVGQMKTSSLKVLFAEIRKCEVRCANCHRIKTAERREAVCQTPKTLLTSTTLRGSQLASQRLG